MRSTLLATALMTLAACQPSPSAGITSGDVFIPAPRPVRREALTTGDGPGGAHLLFLNFEGAALSRGLDDSSADVSEIAPGSVSFPAFDAAPYAPAYARQGVVDAIAAKTREYFQDFNVQVVTTRPATGRYTMCLIGGTPGRLGISGQAAGVAPLDCDNQVEENVVYAFSSVVDPRATGSTTASIKAVAVTCAQEIAHAFGLGHTTDPTDIMYPQLTPKVTGFGGASSLQPDGSGQCSPGGTQDSHGMLLHVLGPASSTSSGASSGGGSGGGGAGGAGPGQKAIVIGFVTPRGGSQVPRDFDVEVAAALADGTPVARVEVTGGGQSLFEATSPPFAESFSSAQDGEVELTATAWDQAGRSASATVRFAIRRTAPAQATGCQDASDCNAPLACEAGRCALPKPSPAAGKDACGGACPDGFACQPDGTCAPEASAGAGGCDPGALLGCPDGMSCVAEGETGRCQPTPDGMGTGAGGCAVSGPMADGRPAALGIAILLACALLGSFRARTHRCGPRRSRSR